MRTCSAAFLVIIVLFSVTAISSELGAAEVRFVYRFDDPRLDITDNGYTRVSFPATMQAGKRGEPAYPFRGVQLLLPPGTSAVHVRIEKRSWSIISGKHRLHPMQQPVPGIDSDRRGGGLLVSQSAYEVTSWVHPPASDFSTHYLRGHAIAVGAFTPVGFHLDDQPCNSFSTFNPHQSRSKQLASDLQCRTAEKAAR